MTARLHSPRVYASIAVALGILALVAWSWWARAIDDAARLFQLLHGVVLAAILPLERGGARSGARAGG